MAHGLPGEQSTASSRRASPGGGADDHRSGEDPHQTLLTGRFQGADRGAVQHPPRNAMRITGADVFGKGGIEQGDPQGTQHA